MEQILSKTPVQPVLITDAEYLTELCQCWSSLDYIVVDTEFDRTDSFYAMLGLIQVATPDCPNQQFLIDPLALPDLSAFLQLLIVPRPMKILHACSEDVEVLSRIAQAPLQGVFDNQIAAAFLGYGLQLGYQNIVKQLFGIDLQKAETRSDWLARPLTQSQIQYAALDVKYLSPCYEQLKALLVQRGRYEWVLEECATLVEQSVREVDPGDYYLKFTQASQFNDRQLSALRQLACWRERMAREKDRPRAFIVKDAVILEIARILPKNRGALSALDNVHSSTVRKYGDVILEIIRVTIAQCDIPPTPAPRLPLPRMLKPVIRDLKDETRRVAQEWDLPEACLMRKRLYEELILYFVDIHYSDGSMQLNGYLAGWRRDTLVPKLLGILQQQDELLQQAAVHLQQT